jgi:predicted  nucleic acid-binding Zn-ribbon protein
VSAEQRRRAWCRACGYEYPDPDALAATPGDERSGCPNCGSTGADYAEELDATASSAASLTAHKPPGSSGESIRHMRGGSDPRNADADLDPGSREVRDRIEGRASTKEAVELRTALTLVQHLNSLGATWGSPELHDGQEKGGREEGVDAFALDGDKKLNVQHTTPERAAWAELAKQPEFTRSELESEAVEALKTAIAKKLRFANRHEIVLALDATDSPRYALNGVVEAFRSTHGAWAKSIGYEAIWLVGPEASLVYRLDVSI